MLFQFYKLKVAFVFELFFRETKTTQTMKPIAKLIYKTCTSYLPTAFPAHFYGMPNSDIYLVYSQFYDVRFGESGLEFVIAVHKEFTYDYLNNRVLSVSKKNGKTTIFPESIDKPFPEFQVIETSREIKSYGEAFFFIEQMAEKMVQLAS